MRRAGTQLRRSRKPFCDEVAGLGGSRVQPVDEVDHEDDRQCRLDEEHEVPRLRLVRIDHEQRQVGDREDRHREHEELVRGALEVAAIGTRDGLAHVRRVRGHGNEACCRGRAFRMRCSSSISTPSVDRRSTRRRRYRRAAGEPGRSSLAELAGQIAEPDLYPADRSPHLEPKGRVRRGRGRGRRGS